MPVMTSENYKVMKYPVEFYGPIQDSDIDNQITLKLNLGDELSPIYAALGYLLTKNAHFMQEEEFNQVAQDFQSGQVPLMDLIVKDRGYLNKQHDIYQILRFVATSPRPVIDNAPVSRCPRCNNYIWAQNEEAPLVPLHSRTWHSMAQNEFQRYDPYFCLYCGQRFKRSYKYGMNELMYQTAKTERHITITKLKTR